MEEKRFRGDTMSEEQRVTVPWRGRVYRLQKSQQVHVKRTKPLPQRNNPLDYKELVLRQLARKKPRVSEFVNGTHVERKLQESSAPITACRVKIAIGKEGCHASWQYAQPSSIIAEYIMQDLHTYNPTVRSHAAVVRSTPDGPTFARGYSDAFPRGSYGSKRAIRPAPMINAPDTYTGTAVDKLAYRAMTGAYNDRLSAAAGKTDLV